MNEIWKDIEGYEGIYQVSNLGNVRSLKFDKIKLLKGGTARGYKRVILCKDGIISYKKVHRLVAETFIENPQNFSVVNHKDENKLNNSVDNLEWCDFTYNNNYGTVNNRRSSKLSKPVCQYDSCGNLINTFNSIKDAGEYLGKNSTNICACLNNRQKTAYGYSWSY